MSARAWFQFLALILSALLLQPVLSSPDSPAIAAEPSSAANHRETQKPLPVGTSSCSARACHGSLIPANDGPIHRDEYPKWLANDKHAQAYRVLFGERS